MRESMLVLVLGLVLEEPIVNRALSFLIHSLSIFSKFDFKCSFSTQLLTKKKLELKFDCHSVDCKIRRGKKIFVCEIATEYPLAQMGTEGPEVGLPTLKTISDGDRWD
jgi:hypothetical protein